MSPASRARPPDEPGGLLFPVTEREKILVELLERTSEAVAVGFPDGRVGEANQAFCRLTGYTQEDLRTLDWAVDLTPPEWFESERAALKELARTGEPATYRKEYLRKDGSRVPVELRVHAVRDEAGSVLYYAGFITDITLQKAAEEAAEISRRQLVAANQQLRAAEQQLRASNLQLEGAVGRLSEAQAIASLGSWELDAAKDRIAGSEEFYRLLGWDQSRDYGMDDLLDVMHPDDRQRVAQCAQTTREGGEPCDTEFRVGVEAEPLIVSVRMKVVRDAAGRPVRMTGTCQDVTARKRAETSIERGRAMLARTEAIAGVGSWEWDVASDRVTWSVELYRILKLDPSLPAPPFAEQAHLFPAEDMARLRMAVEAALTQGRAYDLELRALCSDGTTCICHARGHAEMGPDGRAVRLYGSLQDISGRRLAELALADRERSYRELFENITSGVAIYDVVGDGEDFLFRDLNQAGERIEKLRREDVAGRSVIELRPGIGEFGLLEVLRRVWRTGHPEHVPAARYQDSEKTAWYENTVYRLPSGQVVDVFDDVSEKVYAEEERVRLEATLSQSQKMESVGRLAGGVAHDFNNMLGVIIGRTEMAMDAVSPADPLCAHLVEIGKAAERSAGLTRQLLAYARKQVIVPKVLDLNQTVAGTMQMLRRLIGENIELTLKTASDLWPVRVDPSQVDQVLANLCVNARDAIVGAGRITIETANVVIDEKECVAGSEELPGCYVQLAVRDDGCGMDREVLEHAFEPFATTKGVGQGTGLGLAMVYGIVRQNQGFILVDTAPGRGTVMKIHFPRHQGEAEPAMEEAHTEAPRGCGELVLLVEDEPAVRSACAEFLRVLGYSVLQAEGPAEALALSGGHAGQIDLLVTDVIMPVMNGGELFERLVATRPGLRVLFISGYAADVIGPRGTAGSDHPFLAKPFSREDLGRKVREALAGGSLT